MPFETSDVDGITIFNCILKEDECMCWINLIRAIVEWRDLVNTLMNFRIS
jgi:hypothetical protein